jgi:hypothetical protein
MDGNRWLVVTLALLTVLGLVQSVQIERSSTYGLTNVLYRASGHGLVDLARDGSDQMRETFAFTIALRPYVHGGTVVAPSGERTLAVTAVRGLAGAELLVRDYDPFVEATAARLLRNEARMTGSLPTQDGAREAVGPSGPAPLHVVLVDVDDTVHVVAVEQLRRHAINVAGLDVDKLVVAGTADG